MSRQRSKCWCFTINNPDEDACLVLEELAGSIEDGSGDAVYLVVGDEVGESGTQHIQGYVAFSRRLGLRECKALVGSRSHVEPAKGSPQQASAYCKKEGKFTEWGSLPGGQGHRRDLDDIRIQIRSGVDDLTIADQAFSQWCIYRRSFSEYRNMLSVGRNWVTEVFVFIGDTGTGKSRVVHACANDLWVAFSNTGQWFDGYAGQNDVLFDDFTGEGCKIGFWLQLLDRYSMRVPIKGGSVNWTPKRIFFTSNVDIEEWFIGANARQYDAFKRRITKLWILKEEIVFTDDGRPVSDEYSVLFHEEA